MYLGSLTIVIMDVTDGNSQVKSYLLKQPFAMSNQRVLITNNLGVW